MKDLILISTGNKPDLVKPIIENAEVKYGVKSINHSVETLMTTTPNKPKYVVKNHEHTSGLEQMYISLRRAGAIVNFINHNPNNESWTREELRK